MYHIKEAAQLSGVSVKTLHHYDKIGLLVPLKSENGYRTYSQEGFGTPSGYSLLQISRFSLEKIAELLKEERTDLLPHLTRAVGPFDSRKGNIWIPLIFNLAENHSRTKGEREMSIQEKFAGFNYQDHQKYHQEAVEKYGQEVMDQALERQKVTKTKLRLPSTKSFEPLSQKSSSWSACNSN